MRDRSPQCHPGLALRVGSPRLGGREPTSRCKLPSGTSKRHRNSIPASLASRLARESYCRSCGAVALATHPTCHAPFRGKACAAPASGKRPRESWRLVICCREGVPKSHLLGQGTGTPPHCDSPLTDVGPGVGCCLALGSAIRLCPQQTTAGRSERVAVLWRRCLSSARMSTFRFLHSLSSGRWSASSVNDSASHGHALYSKRSSGVPGDRSLISAQHL
ncbi:hypothetical protein NA57DRAFT_59882 [Rhizodiscina lignyota]|uniref:Uncharacterized protein n=1 Tax=Rhizodiscina lignyota TaxID=1504668 RepID=A0A9P4I4S8_9PEZI|nr:hypothetical protein NA57DRAFT_59882 [Rhizodiscina lignyota]